MEQLAAAGGVTKPILYRHFGDREGLAQALGERYASVLLDRLATPMAASDPRELLRGTLDAYLGFLEDEPNLHAFLAGTAIGRDPEVTGALAGAVARRVAVTIGDQLRSSGLDAGPAEPYAHGLVGLASQAGDWWIRNRTMSREALLDYLTRLLWTGFLGLGEPTPPEATVLD